MKNDLYTANVGSCLRPSVWKLLTLWVLKNKPLIMFLIVSSKGMFVNRLSTLRLANK